MGIFAFSRAPRAASTSDLEKQILSGASTEAPAASEAAPESDQSYDTEVPEVGAPTKPKVDESQLKAVDEAVRGPRQIPNEHILVVQHRFIQKEGAHEFTPISFGVQPADSFRRQVQWGFSYMYHLNESIGLEFAHVSFTTNFSTGLNKTIAEFQSRDIQTARIEPVLTLGASLQWSPLKSKAATADAIYYFEGYFLGGGGLTRLTDGNVGMAMAGFGFRSWLSRSAILKTELRDYMDFRSQVNHRPTVVVGASVLFGGGGS